MRLFNTLRVAGMGMLFSGAALFSLPGGRASESQGPSGAVFTLPDAGATVDLDAYRNAFNKWPRHGGHTRARNAGAQQTNVTIEAYGWAHAYGPKHVPPEGKQVLVGHLLNEGSRTTDMYSLKPGAVAEYFLFATNVNGKTGWEMREVGSASSGTMPVRASGLYTSCNHEPASKSEADFRQCSAGASASAGKELQLAASGGWISIVQNWLAERSKPNSAPDDPAWISCDGGCCTLNGA